ncbi:hypothetical protein GCK32_005861 [Trichostrongylus colubriformis]|uniref:Uncharacterized protein n=1 Tax=Trichostrongylus colubriformis TaxID=6319 RepID=A0AAN8IH34_TRICO
MAFPLGLLVAGALFWGLMQTPSSRPPATKRVIKASVNRKTGHQGSLSAAQLAAKLGKAMIGPNGTSSALHSHIEELRRNITALEAVVKAEQLFIGAGKTMIGPNGTSSALYSHIEELRRNITALEAVLKAEQLFSDAVMKHFSARRREEEFCPIDACTFLLGALGKLPAARQKCLIDYQKSSDRSGKRTSDGTEIPLDPVTSVTTVSLYSSTQDVQEGDIRKSLKFIETVLVAANNSLPIGLQKQDSLTLTIQIIRLTLTNRIPLTFHGIKPIFMALSESSRSISEYFTSRSDRAEQLDFVAIAMKDVLKVLCDIAVKLDPVGLLLKSYFEYSLGEKAELSKVSAEFFGKIEKVANAARFC